MYPTMSTSIGYWLLSVRDLLFILRRAIRWDRYTATMCPTTIAATPTNHTDRALIIEMFGR